MTKTTQSIDDITGTVFSLESLKDYTTAINVSGSLSKMNTILEKSDMEGIPTTSLETMRVSLESIRNRLIVSKKVKTLSLESITNTSQLKIAIEENKGLLKTVWDAIVNFFKSIYDWIAGFFGKKKNQSSEAKSKIEKSEEEAKKLNEYLSVSKKIDNNYTLKEEDSFLEIVKKKDSLSSEKPDILPINKNISSDVKPTTVEMDAIVTEIKETIAEKKPLTFDTDRYSNLFI
jgi:hypothetical protein